VTQNVSSVFNITIQHLVLIMVVGPYHRVTLCFIYNCGFHWPPPRKISADGLDCSDNISILILRIHKFKSYEISNNDYNNKL
jgi:hypothetical protein